MRRANKADSSKKRLCLGIITGIHGIRGEVVIKSFTQDPLDIGSYGPLSDETGERRFVISAARLAKKGVVARLDGIADRDDAKNLQGTRLFVDRDRLPATGDDDVFYHADLVGLDVFLANGDKIGTVTALHNFGAGDLIEIRIMPNGEADNNGGSEIYPFNRQIIPEIDIAARRLILSPPEMIVSKKGGEQEK